MRLKSDIESVPSRFGIGFNIRFSFYIETATKEPVLTKNRAIWNRSQTKPEPLPSLHGTTLAMMPDDKHGFFFHDYVNLQLLVRHFGFLTCVSVNRMIARAEFASVGFP